MNRYVVKSSLLCNHKEYETGDTLELDDKTANPLLATGTVELMPNEVPEKQENTEDEINTEGDNSGDEKNPDQGTDEKSEKTTSKKDKGKGR